MRPAKRAFDLVASAAGLLLLLPLFVVVAIAIRLDDAGPIFFRQVRVGRDGRPFFIWKFRTMVPEAEELGPQLTVSGDPRITRVGDVLRRWKIDELPQLLNVVRGEMSLVGPRPEAPRYVALYTEEQRRVLALTPGITDPATLRYRDESELLAGFPEPERTYVERIMPLKLRMNLEYSGRATLWTDLRLILHTVLGGSGPEPSSEVRARAWSPRTANPQERGD